MGSSWQFLLIANAVAIITSSIHEFYCKGPQPFDCVGDHIVCDGNERCNILCYDAHSGNEPGLCDEYSPGCCRANIDCPINGICSISCSYNCQNIHINASLSESLIITDCIDESCNNMTIYCPENNEPNSCQIHDSANSVNSTIISNIEIYTNIGDNDNMNINITNTVLLSGYLYCNNNENRFCQIDSNYPSLCINGESLNCNDNDNDEYNVTIHDIFLTSENINIYNESMIMNENIFWIEFIAISVGLSLLSLLCMFCCKMDYDQDKTNHDTKQQQNDDINKENDKQPINDKSNEQETNLEIDNDKNNETLKKKERILSDTENNTDNEFDDGIDERIENFKHSLSIQIQNEMIMMDDVLKEIRRDSLYRIGDKIDMNQLKEENETLHEEETDDTETDIDDEEEDFCVNV